MGSFLTCSLVLQRRDTGSQASLRTNREELLGWSPSSIPVTQHKLGAPFMGTPAPARDFRAWHFPKPALPTVGGVPGAGAPLHLSFQPLHPGRQGDRGNAFRMNEQTHKLSGFVPEFSTLLSPPHGGGGWFRQAKSSQVCKDTHAKT